MAKAKAGAAKPADIEVLNALPEQALTAADAPTIVGFLAGLVPFFTTARQLETEAKTSLERARQFTLPAPGDVDGDAKLQTFIKDTSAQIKAVNKHWEITSVLFQFQRKLVAARDRVIGDEKTSRGAGYLVEASNIAQRLHNTYVEDAKRRAAAEQERLRRIEEEAAAERRRVELEQLEAKAIEAEATSGELSEREKGFVAGVVAYPEGTVTRTMVVDIARRVGYKDAAGQGARLIESGKIVAAIKAARDAAAIRQQAAAVKEAPLDVQETKVNVEVARVGVDRSSHSGELLDERLLIEAIIGGKHGIPTDILQVNPAKLNEYARSLHELINRWPGVRYKKNTKTV